MKRFLILFLFFGLLLLGACSPAAPTQAPID